jgi:Histidine kinase-, DNA gyrase B-, and HSP90-like ATPase
MKLDPAPFQLREFLNRVAAVLTVSARKKGLDFSMSVDSSVPDGLVGDSGRLNQVLLNLAGNAIKFTETGSVANHVECHRPAEAAPGETGSVTLCFSVRATGIGVDPDRLAAIGRLSSGVPPVAMIESGAVREAMHHVKARASEIDPAAPRERMKGAQMRREGHVHCSQRLAYHCVAPRLRRGFPGIPMMEAARSRQRTQLGARRSRQAQPASRLSLRLGAATRRDSAPRGPVRQKCLARCHGLCPTLCPPCAWRGCDGLLRLLPRSAASG